MYMLFDRFYEYLVQYVVFSYMYKRDGAVMKKKYLYTEISIVRI